MITVEQARQALPKGYEMTDEELSQVIADAYLIANFAVNDFLHEKHYRHTENDP